MHIAFSFDNVLLVTLSGDCPLVDDMLINVFTVTLTLIFSNTTGIVASREPLGVKIKVPLNKVFFFSQIISIFQDSILNQVVKSLLSDLVYFNLSMSLPCNKNVSKIRKYTLLTEHNLMKTCIIYFVKKHVRIFLHIFHKKSLSRTSTRESFNEL